MCSIMSINQCQSDEFLHCDDSILIFVRSSKHCFWCDIFLFAAVSIIVGAMYYFKQ